MKKILCPTNFSDTAYGAIAYAAKLAKATGCDLTLLYVNAVFEYSLPDITRGNNSSPAEIAEGLDALSKEVSKAFKISCYAEFLQLTIGKLSSVIKDVSVAYDLIVMSSHGADNLYQFFGGSNTYIAIVKSTTPLLLIPEGLMYSEIKTMAYAYDYLRERNLPLRQLAQFAKAVNCKLKVLQVMEEAFSKDASEDLQELQFIFKSYGEEGINYEYDTIRSSDVPESINDYIQRTQPDVLALCSIHRNFISRIFHKSIIRHISAVSNMPVFIFHQ
jgi:nucleotide-binding universal stress UspA family protein